MLERLLEPALHKVDQHIRGNRPLQLAVDIMPGLPWAYSTPLLSLHVLICKVLPTAAVSCIAAGSCKSASCCPAQLCEARQSVSLMHVRVSQDRRGRTPLLDGCSEAAGLVEVLRVHSVQRAEAGVLRSVVAAVTQVQAANEGHQLAHGGVSTMNIWTFSAGENP